MKLEIKGTLPNFNDYINACRINYYYGSKIKNETEEEIIKQLSNQINKNFDEESVIFMEYKWYEPNKRRDKDNISGFGRKCIQDALVKMGVIKNDGWKNIYGFSDYFDIDKENPRIEITIFEVKENDTKKNYQFKF